MDTEQKIKDLSAQIRTKRAYYATLVEKIARQRRSAMLVANRNGATFDELAITSGLHRSTVAAEIAKARSEWSGDPAISRQQRPGKRIDVPV